MEAQRDPALDPPAVLSFTHAHTHTGRFDQQTNSFGYPERLHKKKQALNTPETLLECWNISRLSQLRRASYYMGLSAVLSTQGLKTH